MESRLVGDLLLMAHIRHLAAHVHKDGGPPPAADSDRTIEILMAGLDKISARLVRALSPRRQLHPID